MRNNSNHFFTVVALISTVSAKAELPSSYKGKPFQDEVYTSGPQLIPGRVECAYYDLGGEGVAYHDTDPTNHGSGELNLKAEHQRLHANPYIWSFRAGEGVDISYTKDFADFNHTNFVAPVTNQLYIGWTADDEWCNYTVNVKAGTYRVIALYGNTTNTIRFSINHKPAAECKLPVPTSGMHKWNKAEIGTIVFPEGGLQLLTFHYNAGNNFAYFEFEPIPP
jgi:carbohydrate binding protein with CBM35 domain